MEEIIKNPLTVEIERINKTFMISFTFKDDEPLLMEASVVDVIFLLMTVSWWVLILQKHSRHILVGISKRFSLRHSKTVCILISMSHLIDDVSMLSHLNRSVCEINLKIEDARVRNDIDNLNYYYGYRDALEALRNIITSNRVNQRPHVGFKV